MMDARNKFDIRGINWGGLPLDNVERIEVIRGPGAKRPDIADYTTADFTLREADRGTSLFRYATCSMPPHASRVRRRA